LALSHINKSGLMDTLWRNFLLLLLFFLRITMVLHAMQLLLAFRSCLVCHNLHLFLYVAVTKCHQSVSGQLL